MGIDLGVRKRAVLSTGERIERNRRDWAGIRKQQRKISRCKKISKTRRKRIVQLSRLRHREAVRNRNACHRLSSRIIREHGLIAVEKLNIQGMVTKGSKKKGLNREILTQSWGLLRNQLQYKAEWAGREFVEVNPAYTSQDCHRCGARHDPGRSETFRCRACGLGMDRDHNAALNILRAGFLPWAPERISLGKAWCQNCMPMALRYISPKTLLSFSIPPGPGRPQSLGLLTIRRLGSGGSCCLRRRRAISRAGRFTLRLRICRTFKALPFRPQGRPSRRVLGGFKMVVSNTKMACLQSGRRPRTQARLIVSAHR